MLCSRSDVRCVVKQPVTYSLPLVAVASVVLAAFSGGAVTHDDEHGEIHTLTIDRASADTDYYVDVHTDNTTVNTTQTFEAGTTSEGLELELSPTITSDTGVTVALHTENGTEIAASTATVSVNESAQMDTDNTTATESMATATASTEMGNATETPTGGSGPGFGVAAAIAALLGAVLFGRYGRR